MIPGNLCVTLDWMFLLCEMLLGELNLNWNIDSTNVFYKYSMCYQQWYSYWNVKSLFLKEPFLLHPLENARLLREAINYTHKKKRQSAVTSHLCYSPEALESFPLTRCTETRWLDCLKVWIALLLQSSWSPLQMALTCRKRNFKAMSECTEILMWALGDVQIKRKMCWGHNCLHILQCLYFNIR